MLFKKRLLSSPWAFGVTLSAYLDARTSGSLPADLDYDDILGEGQSDDEEGLWEQDEAPPYGIVNPAIRWSRPSRVTWTNSQPEASGSKAARTHASPS